MLNEVARGTIPRWAELGGDRGQLCHKPTSVPEGHVYSSLSASSEQLRQL